MDPSGNSEVVRKTEAPGAPSPIKRLFTVKEASVYLAISAGALYKKIQRGVIPAFKDGRRVKFDRTELDGYISRRLRRYEIKNTG